MENRRTLRIVLASPGDVAAERDAVVAVVSELNVVCRDMVPPLAWELWRWETDSCPGLHLEGPQGIIDEILRIDECDVLVGIFHRRFGTPVADAGSGTEHEIRAAINAWKLRGTPRVMLYFAEDPSGESTLQHDEQYDNVQKFKREMIRQENALLGAFRDAADFEARIRRHLLKLALKLPGDLAARPELETGLLSVSWRPEVVQLRTEGFH
jgi:hypothetical protein